MPDVDVTLRHNPDIIKTHIDMMIHHWRGKLRVSDPNSDAQLRAACYVDAYQSMRSTMFGELLPLDDWQRGL